MSAENTTRYHIVPRPSEDSDQESSSHEQLLPTTNIYRSPTQIYSITFNPVLLLRIVSSIFTLIAFIILVIDGGDAFIAADIFMAAILLLNIVIIISHCVSQVLKVTVELRNQKRTFSGKNRPTASTFLDVILSVVLLICLIIGNALRGGWGGAWKAAVSLGYIAVLLQVSLAVPALNNKSLTLTAKLNDLKGKHTPDTKVPTMVDNAERGPARRRAETEEPRQSAEVLV